MLLRNLILLFRTALKTRSQLALENLALRQQLAVLKRQSRRPKLRQFDALIIVKPETVIRWHRQSFKYYWRWKSRKPGRPKINREIITRIKRMSRENPSWGTPRI